MDPKISTNQRIANKVNKELQRFLPTGASKNKKYSDPKTRKKVFVIDNRKFTIDDNYKPKSPRITKRFKEMFISDHNLSKSPTKIQAFPRNAISPTLAKYKATSPEVAKGLMKMCSNENTGVDTAVSVMEKDQKNKMSLNKLNGILEACEKANKKDFIVRSKMRLYTQRVKTFVSEVEDVFGKTPELILDLDKRLIRENEVKECKTRESALKMIYDKVGEVMIKRAVSAGNLNEMESELTSFNNFY